MKTNLLKGILFIGIIISCYSCENQTEWEKKGYGDYTDYTVAEMNKLKKPVILIGKDKSFGCYSILVKDANDTIKWFGNVSNMANTIGVSYNVGDTIK